jgi:osmotically-inducible protein OsmY
MKRFHHTVVMLALCAALPALAAAPQTPDALVTSNAKLLLWTTAGLRSTGVHVDTNDGIVTLYGKVPTEAQRDLAQKTVASISGVRGVKSLMQVVAVREEKATALADSDVKIAVEKQLKNPSLAASWVTVKSVDKGVVLLSGQAHSYGDYLRAIWLTDTVPGVKRVASEVTTPGDFREDERAIFEAKVAEAKTNASDLRITTDVKMRLWAASQVPSIDIYVDTDDGVVTLFGAVPTAAVKSAAGGETLKVSGVHKLNNDLEVVAPINKAAVEAKDADITRAIAIAFKERSALVGITAVVTNGTVRLTGNVASGWDTLDAMRIARLTPGVHGLVVELKVDDTMRRN